MGAVRPGRDRLRHRRPADPRGRPDDGPARRLAGRHARRRASSSSRPASEATGSRIGSALRLAEQVGVPFEKLLIYAWRRHLAAAVARVEALGANDEDLHTVQVTVGFADLVSFTALSNEMDEDRIGDMVEIFESRCADVVAARHGRVIKTLGDSVLFVSEDPVRGDGDRAVRSST